MVKRCIMHGACVSVGDSDRMAAPASDNCIRILHQTIGLHYWLASQPPQLTGRTRERLSFPRLPVCLVPSIHTG